MLIKDFDVNALGLVNGNYFGLPFTPEESRLVLLSVPWDVTASYGGGSCYAPDAIIEASPQLDFYDPLFPQGWRQGIGTIPIAYNFQEVSTLMREEALRVMRHLERGGKESDTNTARRIERINNASEKLNQYVYETAKEWLEKGKLVGLVGGDHSTPFGFVKALAEREKQLSVLQIDAHADLRKAYQGFQHSHASIMYNIVTQFPEVEKLVQVGVRDFCDSEALMAEENPKIEMYSDFDLASEQFEGRSWGEQCREIVAHLGERVYVSFDIDGLSPDNAPNTGTPVPGGLSFNEAVYLISHIVESGRTIVGFDLCEVSPNTKTKSEWDANVGARILYKLCNLTLKANSKKETTDIADGESSCSR